MAITYTRTYSSPMVTKVGDLSDVVISYQCLITGDDGEGNIVSINNRVDLPTVNPEDFIVYSSLTREIFDNWTDEYLNVSTIEDDISRAIESIINTRAIEQKDLPF